MKPHTYPHTHPRRAPHRTATIASLARLVPLAGATDEQLSTLVQHVDVLTFGPGTVLEAAGRFARQYLYIIDGAVDVTRDDGSAVTLMAGCGIGGVELRDGIAHSATYVTARPTRLAVVFGPPMRRIMREIEQHDVLAECGSVPSAAVAFDSDLGLVS